MTLRPCAKRGGEEGLRGEAPTPKENTPAPEVCLSFKHHSEEGLSSQAKQAKFMIYAFAPVFCD